MSDSDWITCSCGLTLYPFACFIVTKSQLCPSCYLAELANPVGRVHTYPPEENPDDIYDASTYVR